MSIMLFNPLQALPRGPEVSPTIDARRKARRPWDEYDAYLFDIDGTLLTCRDAVHYFAFLDTLKLLSGKPLDLTGVTTQGNTDVGILRDALKMAGIPDEIWRPRLSEACSHMCRFAAERRDEFDPIVLPGIGRLLSHLRARGALLAIATGNLESIGRHKLEKCALEHYFELGAYSDKFEFREDVFRHGLATVCEGLGSECAVCAVGDTPSDIRAARACGIAIIAVATGVHTKEQLLAEDPDVCLSSFLQLFASENATSCSD